MSNMTLLGRNLRPLFLGTLLLLGSCADTGLEFEPAGSSTVILSVEGLAPLEGGLNYQGWVVKYVNGSYWGSALGMFNINESGQMVDPVADTILSGSFSANMYAEEVFGVQVTVELSSEVVSQPSNTYLLGGTIHEGTVSLSLDSWLGMGIDFSPMEGHYILMTPSDDDDGNELSGVWFVDASTGNDAPGLFLPEAPDGWNYEGWVVSGTDTLSTGKFFDPNVSDTTDIYGGLTGAPLYPGQDYLFNAPEGVSFPIDLTGGSVFITMEPWNEWDVAPGSPFFLRLMEAAIPSGVLSGTTYDLNSRFDLLPRGTATVILP